MQNLTTASLEALQDGDQRKVMDLVDKLRRVGLQHILQLPQLVVCGDQSSGKSSVLEAITEIPFPRKENLCTRFATEIVLRRATEESITTHITPDKARPVDEQKKFQDFARSIEDFSELPDLIEEATELMGLGNNDPLQPARAFSRDILKLEISGPGRPQLTLVDLPGLIHSGNKSQTDDDVKLIHSLVQDYIENERTIILAVVSAKNDYANQIILKKCREVDPNGSRTLGIITKPDFLIAGSHNEKDWIDLALNRDIYFELGWHMVKNRAATDNGSFKDRNTSEAEFFSRGAYEEKLSKDVAGIDSLRGRLSRLLNNHLKKELPGLRYELEHKLRETTADLERLGAKRSTPYEQRLYLMKLSTEAHDILKAAVNGHYEQDFFGSVDASAKIEAAGNVQRLRAVIQHLNLDFAKQMRLYGQKYKIGKPKGKLALEEADSDDELQFGIDAMPADKVAQSISSPKSIDLVFEGEDLTIQEACPAGFPKSMTRDQAVEWVLGVLQRSRGRELPGTFNPMLIGQLFWEQSSHWEAMALAHIERVAGKCNRFVAMVLSRVATKDIAAKLSTLKIDDALKASLQASKAELFKVIKDKAGHPSTYNHYYTTTIQKLRKRKYTEALCQASEKPQTGISSIGFAKYANKSESSNHIDPNELEKNVEVTMELNMDKFSAEEALDSEIAYYKNALKYFVDVVTIQIIERHLVRTLPENVISPMVIASLTDEEISYAAAEPAEVSQQREFLENRKKLLEDGHATFRKALGAYR